LSYDTMTRLLAPYRKLDALAGRDLDSKIETLLR